ncbi:unnamed protein product [Cladocopium goreaui]|uniref:Uncharacterized protein n=1 Tax=Cladocopium goreaui TaxID=2562237 RepID=A0A9P1CWI8_9DINO|nr:unnamed protein product [Cladocopium goreaui]
MSSILAKGDLDKVPEKTAAVWPVAEVPGSKGEDDDIDPLDEILEPGEEVPDFSEADDWLRDKNDEMQVEADLDDLFGADSPDLEHMIVKLPVKGEVKRVGSTVFTGSVKSGQISYFTHWTPPAILAVCAIHEDCYTTAPLLGHDVSEDSLVQWLGQGPSFKSEKDHGKFIPAGTYKKRLGRR